MNRTATSTKRANVQFENRIYRGHTIERIEAMGWSDAQQTMVPNGYRLIVEGPYVNINQQTYVDDTSWVDKQIDREMALSKACNCGECKQCHVDRTCRGHKPRGLTAHVRGWNSGVKVGARYLPDSDKDVFHLYATTGSNASGPNKYLGCVAIDAKGKIKFTKAVTK